MRLQWVPVVLCAAIVTACGGSGSGLSPKAVSKATPSPKTVAVTVKISVPGSKASTNTRLRRIFTVASNTVSIASNVYVAGTDTGTPLQTDVANIAAGASDCGASDSYGNRTCSFTLDAPVGDDDFVFTTYDGWTGTAPTGNVIGTGIDPAQTIATGSSPTISVTLNSVIATLDLALVPSVIHSIVPTTAALDVYALDADNDVIVANQFYDANGNPFTATITEGGNLSGSLTVGGSNSATITGPQSSGIPVVYNGNANDAGSPIGFSTTTTATSPVTTGTASLAVVYPTFHSFGGLSDGTLNITGSFHGGAVFTAGASPTFLYTTQNETVNEYMYGTNTITMTANAGIADGFFGGEALVANSTLYFLAQNGLFEEPLSGLGTPISACSGSCPPSNVSGLGYDAVNGFLYYTSGTNLVQYSISGGTTTTAALGVVASGGVSVDGNGNVWVVQNGANASLLEASYPTLSVTTQSLYTNEIPFDVATAGNGNIVVSDKEFGEIGVYNGSGYVESANLPCCNEQPWHVAPDPAQPNIVWFDFANGSGQIGVGRYDLATGIITTESSTIPSGGQPGAIAVSNGGGIMMVYDGGNTLVQVQP